MYIIYFIYHVLYCTCIVYIIVYRARCTRTSRHNVDTITAELEKIKITSRGSLGHWTQIWTLKIKIKNKPYCTRPMSSFHANAREPIYIRRSSIMEEPGLRSLPRADEITPDHPGDSLLRNSRVETTSVVGVTAVLEGFIHANGKFKNYDCRT